MDATSYLALVEAAMGQAGYEVRASRPDALHGFRRDFRLYWMGSMHLHVHVATAPLVDVPDLDAFARWTLTHASASRDGAQAFFSGGAAIAAVVGDHVTPAAQEYARHTILRMFGAVAWPVVVDLSTGTRVSQSGTPFVGMAVNPWMRSQIDQLFPVRRRPARPAPASR